jgi:hypothetical protein
VVLSTAEREQLAAIAADRNRPHKHVERARIVLASADWHSAHRVAESIGISRADGMAVAATFCRDRGRRETLPGTDSTQYHPAFAWPVVVGTQGWRCRHLAFLRCKAQSR